MGSFFCPKLSWFVLNCPKLEPVVFVRCSFAEKFINKSKFKKMDKIFKNDRTMGFIALLTFAMVAWMCYQNYKEKQSAENVN